MMADGVSYWELFRDFLNKPKEVKPPKALPYIDEPLIAYHQTHPKLTWFGHSSYLLQAQGYNILVDPVFSGNASPIPGTMRAFPGSNSYGAAQMPRVDLMLLTHDHYDHLDKKTQLALKDKTVRYICPLGVEKELIKWGISATKIQSLDWWASIEVKERLKLTAMPARHFSGRGFINGKTLWASYLLAFSGYNIYIGGDSGYDDHFKQIGDRAGSIDLAILECGQYNTKWPLIHMFPEEVVQAAIDLKARVLMPVHWGKFGLAYHNWDEPILRVRAAANEKNFPLTTPRIGESVIIGESYPADPWWENI